MESAGPSTKERFSLGVRVTQASRLEAIKWLIRMAKYFKEVAEVASLDLRNPTACFYLGKWSRFFR